MTPETPTANIAKVGVGSGTATMLTLLIPKARFGTELLTTRREILAVSLRIPKNEAELSSASEEVP